MASLLLQPIRFFPKLDSQYQRYVQSILSYNEFKALSFFVDRCSLSNEIECDRDMTITEGVAEDLEMTDLHNCRKLIRPLTKLDLIKRIDDRKFLLNPYYSNRVQFVPATILNEFSDVQMHPDYLAWKLNDDASGKKYPSLKRRLHNAEYRCIDNTVEKTTHIEEQMEALQNKIGGLKNQVGGLQDQVGGLESKLDKMMDLITEMSKKFAPKEQEEIKVKLTLIQGGKNDSFQGDE